MNSTAYRAGLGTAPGYLAFYSIAYVATAALQKSIGFVLFLWFAHSLSVEEYATFGLLFALQTGVAGLAMAGIVEAAIGFLKDSKSDRARYRLYDIANAVFTLLATVVIGMTTLGYGVLVHGTSISLLEILFVTAAGIVTAFVTLQSRFTRLEEHHATSLALGFVPPLAGFVCGFTAFLIGSTVSSFFFGMAIGLAVATLALQLCRIGFYGFSLNGNEIGLFLSRIGPFILIALFAWLSGYGSTYLVKFFLSTTDVARFVFAYTLASVMQLVATSLNQVWSPRFFRIVHELPISEVERRNHRFSTLQGLVLGAVGAVVLAGVPLMTKLAGSGLEPYSGLEVELLLLFDAYVLLIPWWHVQNYYYAHSKGTELMNVTLVTGALGVLAWLAAVLVLGSIGVYIGFMLQMAIRTLGALAWARREWAINILWKGPAIALLMLCGGFLVSKPLASLALSSTVQ